MPTTEMHAVHLLDPSELYRPDAPGFADKEVEKFRDYSIIEDDPIKMRVRQLYAKMHQNQTFDFVKAQSAKWLKLNHYQGTIREALEKLNGMLDESDPDIDIPNIFHGFQSAEQARAEYPELDWLHLTALIHDLGKLMAMYGEPHWAVTGDTFPVGCLWSENIVYRSDTFDDNPDTKNPKYNTKYGIYKPNCGIENLQMCWGHDEYMYQVLVHNKSKLPKEALQMIRFHSFYPWHTSGDYAHFESEDDKKMKKWIHVFNRYDLYSKTETKPDVEALWPYYQSLIDKYCPGVYRF